MIIAIDFDGTIVEQKFPYIGKLIPGAKNIINDLYKHGHNIIINSCRSGKEEGDMKCFIDSIGIQYDYINCNLPKAVKEYGKDCRKISADVYIDDRNIGGFIGWDKVRKLLLDENT